MAKHYKVLSTLGAIRLLRVNSSFRLIRTGEELEEGDLIEILSPISSLSLKSEDGVKTYEGVKKLKVSNHEIIDVTAQSKPVKKEQIISEEKTYEFVEQITFDMYAFLKTKLELMDIEHIVDHKVLLFDIPHYLKFVCNNEELKPDEGCLIVGTEDTLEIKKFDQKASFIISAYILHNTKISKYASHPKSYIFIKTDDDGLKVIKREESVEFAVEI